MTELAPIGVEPLMAQHQPIVQELMEIARVETRPTRGGAMLLDHDHQAVSIEMRLASRAALEVEDLVVTLDGVVAGYALAEIRLDPVGPVLVIDELFIHPQARGVGLGSALVDLLDDTARTHDCRAIESMVLPGNRDAKNFFERLGMVTRKMIVSRQVGD